MLIRHVDNLLTEYLHGELDEIRRLRVEQHCSHCGRCKARLATVRAAHNALSTVPKLSHAPESVWKRIEQQIQRDGGAVLDARSAAGRDHYKSMPSGRRFLLAGLKLTAAAACLILGAASIRHFQRNHEAYTGPSWQVTRLSGRPEVEAQKMGQTARLGVGQWLETDGKSQAEITVADIGRVDVEPNTRIGLIVTRANEHRLSLQRGEMSAKVLAPPRLFFVDTPSSTAVDLGCAYTLKVEANGDSVLHVNSGHVALTRFAAGHTGNSEMNVPAGATCRTRKGIGPGTPFFDEASSSFKAALIDYDLGRNMDVSLNTMLKEAQLIDTLSLWYMMTKPGIPADRRAGIITRMMKLIPPPDGVTHSGLLKGDAAMLRQWHETLEPYW